MKILFLVPYPLGESPSQRFRFEQYFGILSKQGYSYQVQSFLDSKNWRLFFDAGRSITRITALLKGFSKRFAILFQVSSFDFIFIHREMTPIGPPVFEWLLANVLCKKIIYDFDDAIWLTDRINESRLLRLLKWRRKVKLICGWSYRVSAGNDYLVSYARQFNANVICNPTTIDTEGLHNPEHCHKKNHSLSIGWTGSHSTVKYLTYLEPVFKQLENDFPDLQFIVIADKSPQLQLKSLVFIPWSLQNEMSDLCKIDIGIMPLPDDEWSKGKCGFKALQFMALQIPVVASPIGVNVRIIQQSLNGFLASSEKEWIYYLSELIKNEQLRVAMGQKGREKTISDYSVNSNAKNFVALFS